MGAAPSGTGQATGPALPDALFRHVRQEGGAQQVWLCLLAAVVFPLTTVPLELQRRIIDQAIGNQDLRLLAVLGAVHLAGFQASPIRRASCSPTTAWRPRPGCSTG